MSLCAWRSGRVVKEWVVAAAGQQFGVAALVIAPFTLHALLPTMVFE